MILNGTMRFYSVPKFKLKKSEDLVNYIKEKRRAKGLPTYED